MDKNKKIDDETLKTKDETKEFEMQERNASGLV